jgi:dual specificity tyrosine-phosphorylation-regulated kinase 1
MVPDHMLEQASEQHRLQFFERRQLPTGNVGWYIRQHNASSNKQSQDGNSGKPAAVVVPPPSSPLVLMASADPIQSLTQVIRAETHRKKKYPPSETGNSPQNYELFVDLIHRMLAYDPRDRIKPEEALNHPFVTGGS